MRSGELNSAECYEQSACQNPANQEFADHMDQLDNILNKAQNYLRTARLTAQRDPEQLEVWQNLDDLREMELGVQLICRQIMLSVRRQASTVSRAMPSEYMR